MAGNNITTSYQITLNSTINFTATFNNECTIAFNPIELFQTENFRDTHLFRIYF